MSRTAHKDCHVILVAEDDPGDQRLITKAFEKKSETCEIRIVDDGEQLIDYLLRSGSYSNAQDAPRPSLVLLDLNMPKKDGRTALREIKSHSDLRRIPVVILSTSERESDIRQCYDLGANTYMTKPSNYPELLSLADQVEGYWFKTSKTPLH